MEGTNYCKWGIAEDLKNRMYQYKTHNPFDMEIIYLKENLNYELAKNLESYLFFNDFIALKRINNRNEWVELNELERKKITDELELYIKDSKRKKSKEKEYYVQSE